jgi:hypothetical protein
MMAPTVSFKSDLGEMEEKYQTVCMHLQLSLLKIKNLLNTQFLLELLEKKLILYFKKGKFKFNIIRVPSVSVTPLNEYTYFKFSVMSDRVKDIQIVMTPFHGDPDLYIERSTNSLKFPTKDQFEKSSSRGPSRLDHIEYTEDDDGDLIQTYYIAVFGFTHSSYSITV